MAEFVEQGPFVPAATGKKKTSHVSFQDGRSKLEPLLIPHNNSNFFARIPDMHALPTPFAEQALYSPMSLDPPKLLNKPTIFPTEPTQTDPAKNLVSRIIASKNRDGEASKYRYSPYLSPQSPPSTMYRTKSSSGIPLGNVVENGGASSHSSLPSSPMSVARDGFAVDMVSSPSHPLMRSKMQSNYSYSCPNMHYEVNHMESPIHPMHRNSNMQGRKNMGLRIDSYSPVAHGISHSFPTSPNPVQSASPTDYSPTHMIRTHSENTLMEPVLASPYVHQPNYADAFYRQAAAGMNMVHEHMASLPSNHEQPRNDEEWMMLYQQPMRLHSGHFDQEMSTTLPMQTLHISNELASPSSEEMRYAFMQDPTHGKPKTKMVFSDASKKRRYMNYTLKLNSFLKRRYDITEEKKKRIAEIKATLEENNISILDKELILKHKRFFASYGPDWFEAVYSLGGVACEVTDEQYQHILIRLGQIADELPESRSADAMFIIYDILREFGIQPYYYYTDKLTQTRKKYVQERAF